MGIVNPIKYLFSNMEKYTFTISYSSYLSSAIQTVDSGNQPLQAKSP